MRVWQTVEHAHRQRLQTHPGRCRAAPAERAARQRRVIIGYSDPKERRPAKIAGDRGTNAVKYLGEKGIDASRITTRTGAGQAGATNNRRIDVIFVPEGATY